ncbi:MAG: DMT family transporter [Sphingomonas fennica]
MPAPRADRLALPAILLANATLAMGPFLVRLSSEEGGVGPVAAGFWRLALALPLLLALAAATRPRPAPADARRPLWPVLVAAGLFFAADLGAWHIGILQTRLANATLFGNVPAFAFPIYGFIVARRGPRGAEAAGLALAAAGTLLLLGRSYELSPRHLLGDALAILAGLLYTVYLVIMDRVRGRLGPMPALAASTLAGVLPILAFALLLGERVWPAAWGALILLALGSQVIGQGLLVYSVGRLPPLTVGLSLLLQPIASATAGWISYGERLEPLDYAGALLLCAALVLVQRKGATRPCPAKPEGSSQAA